MGPAQKLPKSIRAAAGTKVMVHDILVVCVCGVNFVFGYFSQNDVDALFVYYYKYILITIYSVLCSVC